MKVVCRFQDDNVYESSSHGTGLGCDTFSKTYVHSGSQVWTPSRAIFLLHLQLCEVQKDTEAVNCNNAAEKHIKEDVQCEDLLIYLNAFSLQGWLVIVPLKWLMAPSVQTKASTSTMMWLNTAVIQAMKWEEVSHNHVPKVGRFHLLLQHVSVSFSPSFQHLCILLDGLASTIVSELKYSTCVAQVWHCAFLVSSVKVLRRRLFLAVFIDSMLVSETHWWIQF